MSDEPNTEIPGREGSISQKSKTPSPLPGSKSPKSLSSKHNEDEPSQNDSQNFDVIVDNEDNDDQYDDKMETPIQEEEEEVIPEEPLPEFMRRLVQLPGLTDEMWDDVHDEKMLEFLTTNDKKTLIVFINEENGKTNLVCQNEIPTNPMELFVYFTKTHYVQEINSKELFQKNVQFGAFNGKHLTSLLRLTSGLYAPLFFGNDTWPDSN